MGVNSVHINKLQTLQKRAIRILTKKSFRAHTEPLFKSQNILQLQDLYKAQILIFMYDQINNNLPKSFENFVQLNRNVVHRTTRQSNLYHIPRPRTNFTSKLPNKTFPKIWNDNIKDLPIHISRSTARTKLKTNFLSEYSNVITCNNPFCRECQN